MRKKILYRKILYVLGGAVLTLALAFWILTTFYLDDALTNTGIPKLQHIIHVVTLGRYEVKMSHVTHTDGEIYCYDFEIVRNHYDTSEHGITIERLSIDTVRLSGISWWNLLWGKSFSMKSLKINAPKIYFTDAAKEKHTPDTVKEAITVPPLDIAKGIINDIIVFLPERSRTEPGFRGLNVHLEHFYLDPQHPQNEAMLYSKQIDFELPSADFIVFDTFYMAHIRNMRGTSVDSSLRIDSIWYSLRMSENDFAARQKYATPSFFYRIADINILGINLDKFVSGISFELHKFSVGSWYIDSYLDRTRPADPRHERAILPNELLHAMPLSVSIDSVIFKNGILRVRERSATSHEMGKLFFDRVNLIAAPVHIADSNDGKPVVMNASAYFVGEGLLRSTWIYPLRHKSFDLDIHATVSGFDGKKLNPWLVPFERTEMTDGALDSGRIEMKVRNGINTTTVTPYYHNLSMKILNTDPKKGRGLMEGFKTFMAKAFVLRADNPKVGKPVISATTTRARTRDEELMEFVWVSLRKSLGVVVGGFQ